MKKINLDTNAYSAFKIGNSDVLKILQHADKIAVSSIVLGELIAGFQTGTKTKKNLSELTDFLTSPRIEILSIDEETADFYAKIYASLRKKGKPIPTNDLWIAANSLQHGYKLLSFDKHFQLIDNLIVVTAFLEFIV